MTNKIKKFLYTLEHLIPDGYDEIPTFALYHPLLTTASSICGAAPDPVHVTVRSNPIKINNC